MLRSFPGVEGRVLLEVPESARGREPLAAQVLLGITQWSDGRLRLSLIGRSI